MQHCAHIADYYRQLLNRDDIGNSRERRRIQELLYDYSRGARDATFAATFAKA